MIKFRLYYDKDEEIKWLNEMAEQGWAMESFFAGFYRFEECEKGRYLYQVDLGDTFGRVSKDYREFMEDTGAEIVQNWGWWVILRKLRSAGKFELYTDVDSKIEHYTKIRRMFKVAAIIELVCLMIEIFGGMAGSDWEYIMALVVGAFLIVLINAVIKTNNTIEELKEQKTGIASEKRSRFIDILLPVGLLLNSVALLIKDSVSEYIVIPIQILAIILMLAGVYKTARNMKNGLD